MLTIRHVLLPTDGSAWSEAVFAHAAFFAGRHDARLHVLHVSSGDGRPDGDLVDSVGAGDFRALIRRAAAEAVGLDIVHADLAAPSPTEGILDYAEAHDVDLIVMATHGRTGIAHFVKGSVAETVVRRAPCPVLTVRPTAPHAEVEMRRLLVPVDFSPSSWRAVDHAKALASLLRAEVHLLHVLPAEPPSPYPAAPLPPMASTESSDETRQRLLDLYAEASGPDGAVAVHVEGRPLDWPAVGEGDTSPPAAEILATAEALDADLLVMASNGRTGLERLVLGSVAEETVQKAPCPVFVVKPSGKSLLAESGAPVSSVDAGQE